MPGAGQLGIAALWWWFIHALLLQEDAVGVWCSLGPMTGLWSSRSGPQPCLCSLGRCSHATSRHSDPAEGFCG